MTRWTAQQANTWYSNRPWPCGFNYIPATAVSYTEMWMPYCFDAERIDLELSLAEAIGFNCLRVVLPFVVWEHEPEAFRKRLDEFLSTCKKHGLGVMPCLFDDCAFGSDESLKIPWFGKQPDVVEGWYASGWTPSPGHSMVRDSRSWQRLEAYVDDILQTFKNDGRIWVWDLYNEPTNGGLGDVTIAFLEKVFQWSRNVDLSQPVTVAQWNDNDALNSVIHDHCDIVTFHHYSDAEGLQKTIDSLRVHGRPIINTEWLNRRGHSVPSTCLPVFRNNGVGCMHWGLVNGRTQTDLVWGSRPGDVQSGPWQHDLYHSNYTPYAPDELELFRTYLKPGT